MYKKLSTMTTIIAVFISIILIISNQQYSSICALKILGLFPHPAISHHRFFEPILKGLADAGHNVTVVGYFKLKNPPSNYKDIIIPGDVFTGAIGLQDEWFLSRRRIGHLFELTAVYNWGTDSCRSAYSSSGLQNIIKTKESFDIILMEHFNTDCMMGVAWHLKAPVIALSSCPLMPWHYDRMGNPHIPSYIPSLFQPSSEKMTFSQRFWNYIDVHFKQFMYSIITEPYTNKLLQEQFGPNIPPISELLKQTSLMFVNQHYSMSGAKPLTPSVIELGGIHIQDAKPIEPSIKKILDNSPEGVILATWGSMIKTDTIPIDKRNAMVEAFSELKVKIIWKWENDTLQNHPENVHIANWLQQREILCHPNVKVFLTHGGLMGSSEAAYCGVPVLVTPMFGDQFLNGAAFVNRGMGAIVHYEDITKDNLLNAINYLLKPETMENAKTVSYSFKNRILTPLETAIWWVEHVANTSGAPLTQSYSVFMNGIVYSSLDVIGALTLIATVIIFSWIWLLKRCFCINNNSNNNKKINYKKNEKKSQ